MLGSLVGAHLNADPSGSVSADNLFIWVLGHFGWAALVLLVLREAFRVACFGRSTVATVTLSALWRVAAMVASRVLRGRESWSGSQRRRRTRNGTGPN